MADVENTSKAARGHPQAALLRLQVLRQRKEFLRAARAKRSATDGFILQAFRRPDGETDGVRVGFTCSKKVGNAVARNRAKRRLREIARLVLPHHGIDGFDYVLVGRAGKTAARDFGQMQSDLERALSIVHGKPKS